MSSAPTTPSRHPRRQFLGATLLGALALGLSSFDTPASSETEAAVRGWVIDQEDHICGVSNERHISKPAVLNFEKCLKATSAWKEMKRKKIDPESIEGRALRKKAATAVTKAAQVVRESGGHCSVWKTIRHTDGRRIPDVTQDVKERLN